MGEYRRLHPATLIGRWLRIVPQMLGGGAAYAVVVAREGLGRVLLFAGIAGLIGIGIALLVWWRFRYAVGENEIVIESGVLHRQRRVIPFDRVQDIAIERRLIARLFGTAKVRIETGGSAADEGNLDMIALADAQTLRDHVRHRGAALPAATEGRTAADAGAAEEEPVLFELGLGRLFYSGLFNFSLIFLAAIFGFLQYLEQLNLVDIEEWLTSERADAAAGLVTLQLGLALAFLLVAAGMIAGVARTVAKDFGFRLTRTRAGLRRRRGLFTLSEVVIPIRRTQVALIESGPVARWLGWYRLSFQTLGAERKEGGVQVAAPFARMEEMLPILAEAGFPPPPPRKSLARLPRRGLVRRAGPWLAIGALAAAAALAVDPRAGIGALVLVGIALVAVLRWRKHGYRLETETLFVASGLMTRRLWILPLARTQTIIVSRGPVQRGLGLASLLVDTAGASPLRSPEIVDLDGGDAETLSGQLLGLFHHARARRLQRAALAATPKAGVQTDGPAGYRPSPV